MDVAPAEDGLMGEVGTDSQEIVVRAMPPSPRADQDRSETSDVFWAVWPLLEASLKHPRGDREIAEELDLQLGQARTWLDRAVQEGLASVQKRRRKLYVVSRVGGDQLSLVARTGER